MTADECERLAATVLDAPESIRVPLLSRLTRLFMVLSDLEQLEPEHGPACAKHLRFEELKQILVQAEEKRSASSDQVPPNQNHHT